jgi:hypothetical protein
MCVGGSFDRLCIVEVRVPGYRSRGPCLLVEPLPSNRFMSQNIEMDHRDGMGWYGLDSSDLTEGHGNEALCFIRCWGGGGE